MVTGIGTDVVDTMHHRLLLAGAKSAYHADLQIPLEATQHT